MKSQQPRARRWITAAILAVVPAPIWAVPPDSEINSDEWFALRLQDQPCGYMHAVTRRVGSEVRTHTETLLRIARGAAKAKITVEQDYRETLDGKPLSLSNKTAMGEVPVLYDCIVQDGKIKLTTEQFGAKQSHTYDMDPEIKFAWGQELAQRERGLKPGTSFTIKTYEPSLKPDGPLALEIKVKGKEDVDVLGKKMRLHRVTSAMNLSKPEGGGPGISIETESWVDDAARPVVTTMDMGVIKVNVYRTTKEVALQDAEPPELFLNTLVPVSRKVGTQPRSATFRLRVPATSAQGIPDLPTTGMQEVRRISPNEVEVTVRRLDWKRIRKSEASDAKGAQGLEDYLKASRELDINDKKIQRLSRKAVKGQSTPAEKADALRKFVSDFIEHKGMDVGFATASEVAANRRGDCSEHGVLLAALARAAGLPARGVSGIVEVPEEATDANGTSAFGYHMWTQVHIDGQWVDVDAALRQTDCDPTHIALAIMSLNEAGLVDSISALFPLLGRLQIDVVDVQR